MGDYAANENDQARNAAMTGQVEQLAKFAEEMGKMNNTVVTGAQQDYVYNELDVPLTAHSIFKAIVTQNPAVGAANPDAEMAAAYAFDAAEAFLAEVKRRQA